MTTIFFDVDTQLDFLLPAGALPVAGGASLIATIAAMNRRAAALGVPLISTMDAHAEDDIEFRQWPHHCVAGTLGQRKPAATLLEKTRVVPSRPLIAGQGETIEPSGVQQFLVEKQTLDAFSNPNLAGLLDALGADRCVVYGVVSEICVHLAAMGLLKTGRRVEIVEDAVAALQAPEAARCLAEFRAAGGATTTASAVL